MIPVSTGCPFCKVVYAMPCFNFLERGSFRHILPKTYILPRWPAGCQCLGPIRILQRRQLPFFGDFRIALSTCESHLSCTPYLLRVRVQQCSSDYSMYAVNSLGSTVIDLRPAPFILSRELSVGVAECVSARPLPRFC